MKLTFVKWILFLQVLSILMLKPVFADTSLVKVAVYKDGIASEKSELVSTLNTLGIQWVETSSISEAENHGCNVWVSYPGGGGGTSGVDTWVDAGNGYVQIGDHGADLITNSYIDVGAGHPPQTAVIVDSMHPIAADLPSSWNTYGFWYYGTTNDYIGWATHPGAINIITISDHTYGVAVMPYGSGRLVYIGFNVYGSTANIYDEQVLFNSLIWAAGPVLVTEPVGLQPPLAALIPVDGGEIPYPDKAFKQGRTLPLKLQLFSQQGSLLTDADVETPPQIVAVTREGDAVNLETVDLDAGEANDSGPYFRFSDDNWVYNLSTKDLSSGTYSITLEMPDGRSFVTGFVLR